MGSDLCEPTSFFADFLGVELVDHGADGGERDVEEDLVLTEKSLGHGDVCRQRWMEIECVSKTRRM